MNTILARAERDLRTIATWLAKRSPMGSARWVAAFELAKERIKNDPLALNLIDENLRVPYDVRHCFFKTRRGRIYRVIFTVIGNEIRVLRIRRPAQRAIRGRDLPNP
jgi:plasmid stabilization system protein ParE